MKCNLIQRRLSLLMNHDQHCRNQEKTLELSSKSRIIMNNHENQASLKNQAKRKTRPIYDHPGSVNIMNHNL